MGNHPCHWRCVCVGSPSQVLMVGDGEPLQIIGGEDTGAFVLGDLLTVLVIIFFLAGLLLPLLLDFGLLEFIGALLTKVMRPLFKIPGRGAVDCVTSWIGDGTLGVMLTCNQYESGYYSAREASIISTTFSAVSITFSIVVLAQVDLMQYFGPYYLLICLVGIICALIVPRTLLCPLRRTRIWLKGGNARNSTRGIQLFCSVWPFACRRARKGPSRHRSIP